MVSGWSLWLPFMKQKLFTIGVGQIGSNSLLKLPLSQAEEAEPMHVTPGH